jgi:hypothetical protein
VRDAPPFDRGVGGDDAVEPGGGDDVNRSTQLAVVEVRSELDQHRHRPAEPVRELTPAGGHGAEQAREESRLLEAPQPGGARDVDRQVIGSGAKTSISSS